MTTCRLFARFCRHMARLTFIDTSQDGITRRLVRGKWAYFTPGGERITCRDEIDRLNRIALPPAYRDCWFSPRPDAHLLAFGFDARGRKQYRYHPDWRDESEARKFELCAPFGCALPRLRARVADDIEGRGLPRERAIASVVSLLDTGAIRVGNEAYAKANKSFGATTLRTRHARLERGRLQLKFRGKSGKLHVIDCDSPGLIRCVRRMQDLPGQHLFQYLDDDGEPVPVTSGDVNAYLRETMGEDFTARNFRTWTASALAFGLLLEEPRPSLGAVLDTVSQHLGNTPAIARKSYIHPAVLAAARRDDTAPPLPAGLPRRGKWLGRVERGLLVFLGN